MRPLVAIVFLVAGCDAQPDCDAVKAGEICTWFGTPELAGLSEEGVYRTDATTFWVTDVSFHPTEGWPVIMDWNNHRIVTLDDNENFKTISGVGGQLGDGPPGDAKIAEWNHPTDATFLSDGSLLLAAWHNSRVVKFSPDLSTVSYVAGTGARDFAGDGGPAAEAILDLPVSVRVDEADNIYVTDMANQRIRMVSPDGMINTIAGTGEHGFNGDGAALETSFASPALQRAEPAFKIDYFDGALYVADTHNGRIRRFDLEANTIETIAGKGETPEASTPATTCSAGCGYSGDGGPAIDAELNTPSDVAVASDGTIYIADTDNSCVRRVSSDGIIDTFAGVCGQQGFDGDGGPAEEALLARPFGVTVDPDGVVYISDTYNSVIRRVVPE